MMSFRPLAGSGVDGVGVLRPVVPPASRIDRRHLQVGVWTLVPGVVLFAPMAGLLAFRRAGREEVAGINADTKLRPATEAETARAAALADVTSSGTTKARSSRIHG